MPRAPKQCATCRVVIAAGTYCGQCKPVPFEKAKARWRSERPGNWERLRRYVLRRDRGRCVVCDAPGNQVDHVKPVAEGGDWTVQNLQVLCEEHHKEKTTQEATKARSRKKAA